MPGGCRGSASRRFRPRGGAPRRGIDDDSRDVGIHARARQPARGAKLEEAFLELAMGERGARGVGVERRDELYGSAVARVRSGHGIQGGVVGERVDLRLVERSLELASPEAGGEVQERPRRRRDRDAVVGRRLAGSERWRAMDPQAGPLSPTGRRDGDVDPRGRARSQLPQRRRRGVAQRRTAATRQDRRHVAPARAQKRMAPRRRRRGAPDAAGPRRRDGRPCAVARPRAASWRPEITPC